VRSAGVQDVPPLVEQQVHQDGLIVDLGGVAYFLQAPADDVAVYELVPGLLADVAPLGHEDDEAGEHPGEEGDLEGVDALDAVADDEGNGDSREDDEKG
jgi:hypothetical protein